MNKNYAEPEFKVIITKTQDILTTSGESGEIPDAGSGWETGSGVPIINL